MGVLAIEEHLPDVLFKKYSPTQINIWINSYDTDSILGSDFQCLPSCSLGDPYSVDDGSAYIVFICIESFVLVQVTFTS